MFATSVLARYHITGFYADETKIDGKGLGITRLNCVIANGSVRLLVMVVGNNFAPDGLEQFVKHFVELMLRLTAGVITGTHSILAFSVRVSFWVTRLLAENAQGPVLVNKGIISTLACSNLAVCT